MLDYPLHWKNVFLKSVFVCGLICEDTDLHMLFIALHSLGCLMYYTPTASQKNKSRSKESDSKHHTTYCLMGCIKLIARKCQTRSPARSDNRPQIQKHSWTKFRRGSYRGSVNLALHPSLLAKAAVLSNVLYHLDQLLLQERYFISQS